MPNISTLIHRTVVCGLLAGSVIGASCSRHVDIEQVPIGTRVEVTRENGGVVRGPLTARDTQAVRVGDGAAARSIPRTDVASVELADGPVAPALPVAAKFRELTVPDGTMLVIRLDSAIASDTSHVEDVVMATLTEAIVVDGVEVLPADSVLKGIVTAVEASGKVKGRANLSVHFASVSTAGDHTSYPVSATMRRTAESTKTSDAKKIGIPAAGGAVIGAILGGKQGAAVGAAVGGGAGTAVVLTTAGAEIRMPRGTALSVPLDNAVDVRVPIAR